MTDPSVYGRTIDRVHAAASQNSEILVTLNKTSDAFHAYARAEFSLRAHRAELSSQNRAIKTCQDSTQAKFEKHRTYQDNLVVKYAYYLFCMMALFHKKAKEYEQAYFEALKKQKGAEDRRLELHKNLDDELAASKELEVSAETHIKAHQSLDKLYDQVFSQPTPEFSEQEERRSEYDSALAHRLQAKETFDAVIASIMSTAEDRKTVRENLKVAALDAEEKRQALEIAREKVFEQVAGFGLAPPGYSDCCNRAELQREWEEPPPFEENPGPTNEI